MSLFSGLYFPHCAYPSNEYEGCILYVYECFVLTLSNPKTVPSSSINMTKKAFKKAFRSMCCSFIVMKDIKYSLML